MTRAAVVRGALGAALGAAGAALGASAGVPFGAAGALGVGAIVAFGGASGVVLGILALLAGLGTLPGWGAPPTPWWVVATSGVALGLVARHLDCAAVPLLVGRERVAGAAALAVLGALTLLLPDAVAWLAGPDGGPLYFDAVLRDAATAARAPGQLPAVVPHAQPFAEVSGFLTLLSVLAALLLLLWRAGGRPSLRRPAWTLAFLAGALLALYGLGGLAELTIGSVALPDAEALRVRLAFEAGAGAALEHVTVPSAANLALWSRPMVDGLRLVAGALAAGVALRALTGPPPQVVAEPPPGPPRAVLLALPAAVAAALLAPTAGLALALGAGAVLTFGAVVLGRWGSPRDVAPHGLVFAGGAVWILAWSAAAAGWLAP